MSVGRAQLVKDLTLVRSRLLLARPDPEVKIALSTVRGLLVRLQQPRPTPAEQLQFDALMRALACAAPVEACPLGTRPAAVLCLARQLAGDRKTRADPNRDPELARHSRKRGRDVQDGSCTTEHCAIGRAIRQTLGDDAAATVNLPDPADFMRRR